MIKNRYLSTTMGNFSELAIATQVDASDGTAQVAQPSVATLSLTVAGVPTAGHKLTLTFSNGIVAEYTADAAPTTAELNAGVIAAIEAALAAYPGAMVTSTGTTSQVISVSVPGTTFNTVTITPTTTGVSWVVGSAATFAGGLDADATAADNIKDFVDNALAGSIWAFWDDTKLALKAGDTTLAANAERKFFYAWKQGVATEYNKSTAIPVKGLTKDSIAYNAGTAQVMTLAASTGTYSVGQRLQLTIIDTTGTILPYPKFQYDTPIVSTIDAAFTAIAALINAEALSNVPIVTASATTTTLTITAKTKLLTFKIAAYLETTAAFPTDNSIFVQATTATAKAPIGDITSVTELQKYYVMNNGGVQYPDHGIQALEFGQPTTNVGTNSVTQFGFLLLRNARTETGATRDYDNKNNLLIAIKSTDLATLAAL